MAKEESKYIRKFRSLREIQSKLLTPRERVVVLYSKNVKLGVKVKELMIQRVDLLEDLRENRNSVCEIQLDENIVEKVESVKYSIPYRKNNWLFELNLVGLDWKKERFELRMKEFYKALDFNKLVFNEQFMIMVNNSSQYYSILRNLEKMRIPTLVGEFSYITNDLLEDCLKWYGIDSARIAVKGKQTIIYNYATEMDRLINLLEWLRSEQRKIEHHLGGKVTMMNWGKIYKQKEIEKQLGNPNVRIEKLVDTYMKLIKMKYTQEWYDKEDIVRTSKVLTPKKIKNQLVKFQVQANSYIERYEYQGLLSILSKYILAYSELLINWTKYGKGPRLKKYYQSLGEKLTLEQKFAYKNQDQILKDYNLQLLNEGLLKLNQEGIVVKDSTTYQLWILSLYQDLNRYVIDYRKETM